MEIAVTIGIFLIGGAWVLASTRKKKWNKLRFWISYLSYGYICQASGAFAVLHVVRSDPDSLGQARTAFLWTTGVFLIAMAATTFITWAHHDD